MNSISLIWKWITRIKIFFKIIMQNIKYIDKQILEIYTLDIPRFT